MSNYAILINKIRKKNQKAIAIKGKVCYNYQDKPSKTHCFIESFTNRKKIKKISKNLLTNRRRWCIIPYVAVQQYCDTREWRNWQTRTFEGRVVYTVRVQVPFPAPKYESMKVGSYFLFSVKNLRMQLKKFGTSKG